MPVPSQGDYSFHSFPVVDGFCPVIFYLEQESNIEDFIAFEVFGNVSHY
jgi:hypothetical protein